MADLPAALAAVERRLKPGGLFVSKSVCLGENGWRTARAVVRGLKALGVLPPIQLLTIAALEGAVEDAGFEKSSSAAFSPSGLRPASWLPAKRGEQPRS